VGMAHELMDAVSVMGNGHQTVESSMWSVDWDREGGGYKVSYYKYSKLICLLRGWGLTSK
jgi:hypothetical protein